MIFAIICKSEEETQNNATLRDVVKKQVASDDFTICWTAENNAIARSISLWLQQYDNILQLQILLQLVDSHIFDDCF